MNRSDYLNTGKPAFAALVFIAFLGPHVLAKFTGGLDHELLDADAYPLSPVVYLQGQLHEVVSGDRGRAIAAMGELDMLASEEAPILLCKGNQFADGYIEVLASQVEKTLVLTREDSGNLRSARAGDRIPGTSVALEFQATEGYEDVTLGVLFFNEYGQNSLYVQYLGSIPKGDIVAESFEIPVAHDYDRENVRYAFLFFGPSGEIVTNGRRAITPLLNQIFEDFYEAVVRTYQKSANPGTVPVALAHRFPITLDENAGSEEEPVYFALRIDERGFVIDVWPEGEVAPAVREACTRSLKEWLFLPRLEKGHAVRSRVRVPVHLK